MQNSGMFCWWLHQAIYGETAGFLLNSFRRIGGSRVICAAGKGGAVSGGRKIMNRCFLVLVVVLSPLLTGCYTFTYDSLYKNQDKSVSKGDQRLAEIIVAREDEVLSAAYAAIAAAFPLENIQRLAPPSKGYAWCDSPDATYTCFKFTVSRWSGDATDDLRATGWSYMIEGDTRYAEDAVVPLTSNLRKILSNRGIRTVVVSNVSQADSADAVASKGSGTGFFVSSDGYIITNHHVIADAVHIEVRAAGGKTYVAHVISGDPSNDVALIKVDAQAVPLPIAQTGALQKGAPVFTLGYPLPDIEGKELKATFGKVNALSGIHGDIRFLQIDVPIQPGNSGGPLIADDGSVIGITTQSLDTKAMLQSQGIVPQNVNYAVKSEYILPLMQFAHVEPGAAMRTAGATKDPTQFERSIVFIAVEKNRATRER